MVKYLCHFSSGFCFKGKQVSNMLNISFTFFTQVTIRAYVGQKKASQSSSKTPVTLMNSITSCQPVNTGDQQTQKQGPGRKRVSRMFDYIVNFQEQR